MLSASAQWAAEPTTVRSVSSETNGCAMVPVRTFHSSTRRTERSTMAGSSSFAAIARSTASIAPGTSVGISRMSEPARSACTAACAFV